MPNLGRSQLMRTKIWLSPPDCATPLPDLPHLAAFGGPGNILPTGPVEHKLSLPRRGQ